MFEVGKRYRAIESYNLGWIAGEIIKGEIYTRIKNRETGEHGDYMDKNGKILDGWGDRCFDPTPIDDTPAPRMVTACDIGARVVRVKIDERDKTDLDCPIGRILTIEISNDLTFIGAETGYIYYLSDFVLADEQPKKIEQAKSIDVHCTNCGEFHDPDMQCNKKIDIPDPVTATTQKKKAEQPPQAMIMFGSKPRLMYGSLMQIQGPTESETQCSKRAKKAEDNKA